MAFIINPGDQIVFVRRRVTEGEDGTKVNTDTEFGAVNAGDHLEIQSGDVTVEWDEDRRYFVVKWRC